jgi:circadian clock protein KaiC
MMLGGGYYRGSSILVSGSPGTTKTTLAGSFVAAACRRGERALFVSFDEAPAQIVRNLTSVGIELASYVKSGHLHLRSLRTGSQGAEDSAIAVQREISALRPQVLVIDPISALIEGPAAGQYGGVAQGLIEFAKSLGTTAFVTALLSNSAPENEATRSNVSTIADTWIHIVVPGPRWRTQPRSYNCQVARYLALEPGARADPV